MERHSGRHRRDPTSIIEIRGHQSASTDWIQTKRATDILQLVSQQSAAVELALRQEIESLKTSHTHTTANETSLKRENDKLQKRLTRARSNESSLRLEIETLKTSLTRSTSNQASLKQKTKDQRALLVQAATTELFLRRELEALNESHARTQSQLREEIEVLKTTVTHAFSSERDMRISARETREEWETVEKALREEIRALRIVSGIMDNDSKGKRVPWHVQLNFQGNVGTVEDTIAPKQSCTPLIGSSDLHVLLDDLALQSLVKDGTSSTPHSTSDAFGTSLLPEFAALERATEGLQQAVNSELRAAYAKQWSTSGSIPQITTSTARNLRLLVVLWEAGGVEELLSSLTSVLRNASSAMGDEDCAICTDQILPAHKIVVEGCGHVTCKGCLREYIGTRLGEKVWPIRCPICMAEGGPGRSAQTITRVLIDELVLPTIVRSQWTDFELSQFVIPVTCPGCEKPNLFELAEYNRSTILICNHGCECAWCRDCARRLDIGTPHDCDEALEELAEERKWMRCPRPSCRVMVEKNVGCNHITCRCGMHFCYQCGEDITGKVMLHACQQQA